jgi:hypothetical protein
MPLAKFIYRAIRPEVLNTAKDMRRRCNRNQIDSSTRYRMDS